MANHDAPDVAALLMELSRRSALAGGNPYRARAYARAAESLATLTVPLAAVVEEGRLRAIPGIGETIADIVEKLHRTGTHPTLENSAARSRPASSTCSPSRDCGRRRW